MVKRETVTVMEMQVHESLDPKDFDDIKKGAPHGGPFDRGSADAYYGRLYDPHIWPDGTNKGTRVEKEDMTPRDIELYNFGFNYETDRKDWG